MTNFDLILTHPGGSHKDEFLASCVLLAIHPAPIVRREPTPEELADPAIAILDVGLAHEPEKNNFDHHQFPKDHPPTCSLSLVLQDLGIYDDARQFCEWLEPAEWFDCRGPNKTAKWLGVERELLSKLNSPIDITLLRRFAKATRLEAGEPLWEMMRMIGEDFLDYVRSMRARLDFIGANSEVWTLELEGTSAQVLFLPRTEPLPEEPSMGLDQYIDGQGWTEQIVAVVYPDRRNTGYGLARFRDNPRFDFSRIANAPAVHFAHSSGFMAKTSATDIEELKKLVISAGAPA